MIGSPGSFFVFGCTNLLGKCVLCNTKCNTKFKIRLFDAFGILTSAGIQRRYVRMFGSREELRMIREYWLLDEDDKKDVPPNVLPKIVWKSVSGTENPQNKEKQIKTKKRQESPAGAFHPPTVEEVRAYCNERENGVDAGRFVDYYTAVGWRVGKSPMRDWKAAVRRWESGGRGENPARESSYDMEEVRRCLGIE